MQGRCTGQSEGTRARSNRDSRSDEGARVSRVQCPLARPWAVARTPCLRRCSAQEGSVWARRVKLLLPTSGEWKGGPSQTRIRARGLGLLGAMGRTGRKGEGRRVGIVLWGLAGLRHQHGRQRKLNDGERSCVVGLGHAAATQVTTASILRQWSTVPSENVEIKLRLHSISNVM